MSYTSSHHSSTLPVSIVQSPRSCTAHDPRGWLERFEVILVVRAERAIVAGEEQHRVCLVDGVSRGTDHSLSCGETWLSSKWAVDRASAPIWIPSTHMMALSPTPHRRQDEVPMLVHSGNPPCDLRWPRHSRLGKSDESPEISSEIAVDTPSRPQYNTPAYPSYRVLTPRLT